MNNNSQVEAQQSNRQSAPNGPRAQGANAQANEKISVKFNFAEVQKFVQFEFPRKFCLIELRYTFAKVLDLDLFGRQLEFSLVKSPNERKKLDELKSLQDQDLTENHYEIEVRMTEYGA
ncbi:hypothetical protein TTHERM_00616710 (macronuclear) [Tetrahymena thermophila SB210]|uniref:Uncharacterized protein n=1 Tax=Tetrahymena thermophila (strain SB210) TaxID=312017 RepID=I7LXE9_TETTS|nr:hypothetical protein TTHERM_00616710 [Tetrahymena thermophila SB210]EAS04496.1 hypothetical protein TTHERM_00616710 [Tetrahymena thermophila SB210]|eukprot:XP_001024741.1 hypothetical protein TTHERM_00616710 [Tetrahymena thermophila SB210]